MITGYSIAGSKNNWIWCAWQAEDGVGIYNVVSETYDKIPPLHGRARSRDEALAEITRRFPGQTKNVGTYYAESVRSALHNQKKAQSAKARKAKAHVNLGYLYSKHFVDMGWTDKPDYWVSVEWRITKETDKYIFVENSDYHRHSDFGGTRGSTIRVPKKALDEEGCWWSQSAYTHLYRTPQVEETEDRAYGDNDVFKRSGLTVFVCEALKTLGLPTESVPDQKVIKRAYRRKTLEVHPDRGGDAETFRSVTEAYEMLISA